MIPGVINPPWKYCPQQVPPTCPLLCMAGCIPKPQLQRTVVTKASRSIASLQTRTSTAVRENMTLPVPSTRVVLCSQSVAVERTASRNVTVFTVTSTPIFSTIARIETTPTPSSITPTGTPGLHTLLISETSLSFTGNAVQPSPLTISTPFFHETASPTTISSSPRSPFLQSSSPVSSAIIPLSTVLDDPFMKSPLPPSSRNAEGLSKTIKWVLPPVLLSPIPIIILIYFVLRRRRRRRRLASMTTLVPFASSRTRSRLTALREGGFAMKKLGTTATGVDGDTLNEREVGGSSNLHNEDRSLGALHYNNRCGGTLPLTSEAPDRRSDNRIAPASRSEVLELRTRVDDIEARLGSFLPPEYSSERGH